MRYFGSKRISGDKTNASLFKNSSGPANYAFDRLRAKPLPPE
jgi:hypothetical protein